MPRVFGEGAQLHVSEVDAIVENHVPLLELPERRPAPEDEAIGHIIAGLVPDGACLQMGVGALPNLVCASLRDRSDLGVHTEALNPGLIDLIRAGVVTNQRKALDRGKTLTGEGKPHAQTSVFESPLILLYFRLSVRF
jgi:itaconate CoA-transferase